ncbi:MAG: hypothetical protein IH822_07110 [Chloroflexi bacterium]|nr:hypothetical protein [Chloroflexota bacterium]
MLRRPSWVVDETEDGFQAALIWELGGRVGHPTRPARGRDKRAEPAHGGKRLVARPKDLA